MVTKTSYTVFSDSSFGMNTRHYGCRFCGKIFSRPSKVREHERKHTGEKPYACDICGQKFSLKGNMKGHKRRHFLNKVQGH